MTAPRRISIPVLSLLALLSFSPALAQKVSISGTVTLRDGTPVPKAEISATCSSESFGTRTFKATTKADGRFSLPFSEAGGYRILAHKEGLLMFSMAVLIKTSTNQLVHQSQGEIGPGQEPPQFPVSVGQSMTVDIVMVPKDFFSGQLAVVGNSQATRWLEDANRLTGEKKFAESDALIRRVVEADPGNANAWYLAGVDAAALGRTDDAERDLGKALELNPKQQGANAQLGTIAYRKGDKEKAVEYFRKELDITPTAVPVTVNLGIALQDLGRSSEAAAAYEKVIAAAPDETNAYVELANLYTKMGQEEKAAEVLTRMEKFAKPKPAFWFNIGANYENQDKLDEAERAFRKALEIDPDLPEANREMGYLAVRRQEPAKAIEFFKKYLALRPKAPDAPEISSLLDGLQKKAATK